MEKGKILLWDELEAEGREDYSRALPVDRFKPGEGTEDHIAALREASGLLPAGERPVRSRRHRLWGRC
jgi:hypothetical protein